MEQAAMGTPNANGNAYCGRLCAYQQEGRNERNARHNQHSRH